MKKLLNLNTILLLLGGILWSCNADDLNAVNEGSNPLGGNITLSNDFVITQADPYHGPEIPLVNKHGQQVGNLGIFNTSSTLHLDFLAVEDYAIDKVQLWVGTDPHDVPMNNNMIPIPGKFTYKASDQSDYEFNISISDILTEIVGTHSVYIYAHVELVNTKTNETQSAWSDGASFGTTRWGSFSEYICVVPGSGSGCYQHAANCGMEYNGNYYYNNLIGGYQNIYTSYGKIIGTVNYENGKIYFLVNGNWVISDAVPPVLKYRSYSEPGTPESDLIAVNPLLSGGPKGYYAEVPESNYYMLELKIQYCY